MSKSSENIPIKTNLLKQNCFLRECVSCPVAFKRQPGQYESLDEVSSSNGIELKPTVNDYPITPQYVNSFVDSSDYRRDPLAAIANGRGGVNLGDMRQIQEVASMDMEHAKALYNQLAERFKSAGVKPTTPATAVPPAVPPTVTNSGGDK